MGGPVTQMLLFVFGRREHDQCLICMKTGIPTVSSPCTRCGKSLSLCQGCLEHSEAVWKQIKAFWHRWHDVTLHDLAVYSKK